MTKTISYPNNSDNGLYNIILINPFNKQFLKRNDEFHTFGNLNNDFKK